MDTQHHGLGEAVEEACADGMNFVDWPGAASHHEVRQLRAEGYHVDVNSTGVHVRWHGTWWGDTTSDERDQSGTGGPLLSGAH